jgi:acyl-CoA synthetase (AMP-forming)/AMP-acid ligase II
MEPREKNPPLPMRPGKRWFPASGKAAERPAAEEVLERSDAFRETCAWRPESGFWLLQHLLKRTGGMGQLELDKLYNLGKLVNRNGDPDKVALIDLFRGAPREFTHGELDRAADAVARALTARGFQRGERIAILAPNSAEYLIAYLGTMRAGLVSVPVNFKFPKQTIAYILRDAGARMVFVDRERRGLCPDEVPAVVFEQDGEDVGGESFDAFLAPGPFEPVRPEPDEIAMFLYTSGSTGRPKGVPLTHAGQLWAIGARAALGTGFDGQRLLVAAPLYHMNALFISKFAMALHASEVLLPQFDAVAYIEAIERHGCTWLTSVPTMLARVAQERERLASTDLSSVRVVAMGSAPTTQKLIDTMKATFPQARVALNFGTTEGGPAVFGPHPEGIPKPDIALGYPLPGIGVRLANGVERNAREGVLELLTPANMPGYHNLPEKTAEVTTGDGWYITGDVMRMDDDGFYYFVGRADDMFVCGGENVYPGEVEKMLERHPDIQQACVVPVPDELRGQMPVAFVVARPGARLDEQGVKAHALANGPAFQHPRRVAFLAEMPLAGTNKVDRNLLAQRAADAGA